MRTIICGAGQVGYNIASYLAREKNDVTVIDIKRELVSQVNEELDATGIVGQAADPDVLKLAGAEDADMIIAVTHMDEVNMVACQVAHSLFNIPKKVARIRQKGFLDPAWANLFSRAHMPIDVIISPEREVALNILQRLKIPGTTEVISLLDGRAYCVSVVCEKNCPILNTPLGQLRTLFPDLKIKAVLINRNGKWFMPDVNSQFFPDDEVTFIVSTEHLKRALEIFGHEERESENILIIGGGNIGTQLSLAIHEAYNKINLKIIESNLSKARFLSEMFPKDIILHGDGLDKKILQEAGIDQVETVIAVTNDDEVNILSALIAREFGDPRTITLVNKEVYSSLTPALHINAIVSPRIITASTIMRHVRRGRVHAVHDLRGAQAELLEAHASESCRIINTPLERLNLPEGIVVAMILRDNDIIVPTKNTIVKPDDLVVMFATHDDIDYVEKLFSFKFDLV